MAEAKTAPARHPAERQGALSRTFGGVSQLFVWMILALVFSIVAEWVGMAFFWPEEGPKHSEAMLESEVRHLEQFRNTALVERPARFARDTADFFHEYLYRKTGIEKGLLWLAHSPTQGSSHRKTLAGIYRNVGNYMLAAMTITQVFAVRLCVLILSFPAYVLLGLVGLTDGLAQRDLRRWGGGRETSFVYHWAMRLVAPTLIAPWVLYLSIPVSIHPNWVVLPFAILFAISVAVMSSTFKKYL